MPANAAIGLLVCWLSASGAAQLIEITPSTFDAAKALAETARTNAPTSPTAAVAAFDEAFETAFGDVRSTNVRIVDSKELSVRLITPLDTLQLIFANALRNHTAFPMQPPPSYVAVQVRPSHSDAPNITRVALFVNDQEVPPVINNLKPAQVGNRLGGFGLKSAGVVAWKSQTFNMPGVVKVVLLTDGPPIEWEYAPRKPGGA